METESLLLWGLIFGSVGLGYFIYGRGQEKLIPKYSGIALVFSPYLVPNVYWLIGIGASLLALSYVLRE